MITGSLVTYKHQLPVIRKTLDSVLSSGIDMLFVVDNSSLRELEGDLQNFSETITYIPSENRGFGAGHNIAIRKAMELGADYHVIVNPDIHFESGTIEKIISFMDEHPEIGLVMPKTIYPDGRMQYQLQTGAFACGSDFQALPAEIMDKKTHGLFHDEMGGL